MNKKLLYLFPLLGIIVILQLVFFWMAPKAECSIAVYVITTLMTTMHMGISYGLWYVKGMRRSLAVILVGTVISAVLIIVSGGMLFNMATVRTALFGLSIISLIYFIVISSLVFVIESDKCINTVSETLETESQQNDTVEEISTEITMTGNQNYHSENKNIRAKKKTACEPPMLPPPLPSRH